MSPQGYVDDPGGGADDDVSVVHQALRREVNEEISDVSVRLHIEESETMEVMCECVHAGCTDLIPVPMAAYEQVRHFATHFFVRAGHEVSENERVVSENDGYVVVEKFGGDGSYAVSSDPRTRRSQHRR
jgi:8-oxo-dGTP pyrophosphatase MutT (NUDIX family)